MSDPAVAVVRKELRRLFPELKVEQEQILDILVNDVLKREVVEGDKVKETQQRLKKALQKIAKQAAAKPGHAPSTTPATTDAAASAGEPEV